MIYGSSRLGSYNGKTDQGKRTLGNKKYELSNHLGNVLSVISDNKIGIDSDTDLIADYYEPLVISESDYYPFGMAMKERSFSNEEYRFGFNTQEKSTEIGEDTYTAEFWQYDSKIARRWNNDPRPNTSISVYAAFANSPIMLIDHLGDTTDLFTPDGIFIDRIFDSGDNVEDEIHFINKATYNYLKSYFDNPNELAFYVRESSDYYIGIETKKGLLAIYERSANEVEITGDNIDKSDAVDAAIWNVENNASAYTKKEAQEFVDGQRMKSKGLERPYILAIKEGTRELQAIDIAQLTDNEYRNARGGNYVYIQAIKYAIGGNFDLSSVIMSGHTHLSWHGAGADTREPSAIDSKQRKGNRVDYTTVIPNRVRHAATIITFYEGNYYINIYKTISEDGQNTANKSILLD